MAKDDTKTATATTETKPLVYTLVEPVVDGKETVTELPYRKATGRDMRKMLNTSRRGDRYMIGMVDLFERPETFFNKVSGPDFMALTDIIDGFFKPAQPA